jgi:sec-independent protein translocase protein TatC
VARHRDGQKPLPLDQEGTSAEMPFLDHLEELRWRILKSLLGVAIAFVFTFWLCTASGLDIIGIATKPIEPYLHGQNLKYTNPIEPFTILLQAAGVLAVVIAFPVVGYQIWAFLSPALSKSERKVLIPVLIAATLLFLAGIAMSVFVFVPVTMSLMEKLPHASIDGISLFRVPRVRRDVRTSYPDSHAHRDWPRHAAVPHEVSPARDRRDAHRLRNRHAG